MTIHKNNTYNINYYNLCVNKSDIFPKIKEDLLQVNVENRKDSKNVSGINLLDERTD